MIVLKDQKIARNPVAKAIAAQQLKKRMVDQRIHLFMLEENEDARAQIMPISDSVFIVACAYEMMEQKDTVNYRKLRSAMQVLTDCAERGFIWRTSDAVTIDNAIGICVDNWTKIPSVTLQKAMTHILGTMK
jgi:hypothetical protein